MADDIFATLAKDNKEDMVPFADTAQGEIGDWLPTLIPGVDSVMMGGIPLAGRVTEIFGTESVGKAIDVNTLIPTPEGKVPLKDLKTGDTVFDRKGEPTKILGDYPQGKLDTYRVTLSDGRHLDVNNEHMWTVYDEEGNKVDLTTQGLMDRGVKDSNGIPKYSLPVNKSVKYSKVEVKVPEVIVGLALSYHITNWDKDSDTVLDNFDDLTINTLVKMGLTKELTKEQKEYLTNIVKTGTIPEVYQYNYFLNRVYLLYALTLKDTLKYSADEPTKLFKSTDENLVEQVKSITCSLGWDFQPLTLHSDTDKQHVLVITPNTKANPKNKIGIISIENLHKKTEMKCLYVDNEEHLFLAGDYIVTHNTTFVMNLISTAQRMHIVPIYYDVEGTADRNRFASLGVDTKHILTTKPKKNRDGTYTPLTIESIFKNMITMAAKIHNLDKNQNTLFIWDTVALTQSEKVAEKEVGEQTVGQQARAISEGVRKLNVNLLGNNASLIALNQARADIGGNPMYPVIKTVGGKAWQHEASLRLNLVAGAKEVDNNTDKNEIGHTVKVKFIKSKVGDNGGAKAEAVILKDTGFDIIYNTFLEANNVGIIRNGGSYKKYTKDSGEEVSMFKKDFLSLLKSDEGYDLFKEIWQKLIKLDFPQCYPPLFNVTTIMSEDDFPEIKGLRQYYIDIQEDLPEEEQHAQYKMWKAHNPKLAKKSKKTTKSSTKGTTK